MTVLEHVSSTSGYMLLSAGSVKQTRERCRSFSESHLTISKPYLVLGDEKTEEQRENVLHFSSSLFGRCKSHP
jgi:hypothetical protein